MEREVCFRSGAGIMSPSFCSIYATNEMGLIACFYAAKRILAGFNRTINVQISKFIALK